ncbi:restriction endonuclease subunit S [Aliarcobacter butzleri]|uniref:restriction endonuclease subunit S n=1 Tax=Aliarcobacter butzleri TaxID=28197 RepID=UPI00125F4595|nr:restriction endonuclease subunit S [Aliarcobacter butzleri]
MSNLPKDWELKRIGSFAIIVTGNTPPTKDIENFGNEYPWITPTDIKSSKDIFSSERKLSEKGYSISRQLPKNTVLITSIASIGKNAILRENGSCNQQINAILPSENHNTDFIYYWFEKNTDYIKSLAGQTAVPILNKKDFSNIIIPLPPLEEQKKIADILSTVDKKIAFVEENINATEELKKALMQKLLTEGIGHTEFKDSELGRIPESWNIVKLKDIFERVTRKNIENNNNALTISAQLGLVNQKEYFNKVVASKNLSNYYLILKGEFAYNKSYSAGYPMGVIKRLDNYEKGVLSTLYICFKINSHNINSNYILQYFSAGSFDKELSSIAQEGARNHGLLNVGVNDFFNLRVILPCIQEQEQIAEILSTVDNKLENLKEKKQYFEELKKGLMQKLLTGEVRV